MPEQAASQFTFQAIARVLAEVDVFRHAPSYDDARHLGIDVEHLRYHYEDMLFRSRGGMHSEFWQRWTAAYDSYLPQDPRSWEERFLQHEFALFRQATTPQAHMREHILCELRHVESDEPASPAVQARIRELCFWPGVIFLWVQAHVTFADAVHRYTQKWHRLCKRYVDAGDELKHGPFRNDPTFSLPKEKIAALQHLLQNVDTAFAHIRAWSRDLGLDKQLHIQPSKQRMWTFLFQELVDLLRPFFPGRKHEYIRESGAIPESVYNEASHLMHLAQPQLWVNDPTLVKARLDRLRRKTQS